MIYSDAELKRWWHDLSKVDRRELIDSIREKSTFPAVIRAAKETEECIRLNVQPSLTFLSQLRKWAR